MSYTTAQVQLRRALVEVAAGGTPAIVEWMFGPWEARWRRWRRAG